MTDLEKQLNEEYGDTYERGKNGLSSELTTCPSCGKKDLESSKAERYTRIDAGW